MINGLAERLQKQRMLLKLSQKEVAVALADSDSVFYYYQKLIQLRKTYPVFREGSFTLLCPEDEKIFVYTRDYENAHMLVVCNFTEENLEFEIPKEYKEAKKLIGNYSETGAKLRPYEAFMLYYEDNK